jgi:hypothetical protein
MGEKKKDGNRWQMLTSNSAVIISGACSKAIHRQLSYPFWLASNIPHILLRFQQQHQSGAFENPYLIDNKIHKSLSSSCPRQRWLLLSHDPLCWKCTTWLGVPFFSTTSSKYVFPSWTKSDSEFQCLYPIRSQLTFTYLLTSFCSDTTHDALEICPL